MAETVPEAPRVVVMAGCTRGPCAASAMPPPRPPAPPVAVDRLEPFPEPSVVVVVAEVARGAAIAAVGEPLAPAPPVAKRSSPSPRGYRGRAAASPASPPSLRMSNDPGITGTIPSRRSPAKSAQARWPRQTKAAWLSFLPPRMRRAATPAMIQLAALCRHSSTSALREGRSAA